MMVWGLGEQVAWGACPKVKESRLSGVKPDGSGVLKAGESSLAVDFSGASGADALLVMTGPGTGGAGKGPKATNGGKAKTGSVEAGGTPFHYLILSGSGKFPEPKAEGGKLIVGNQTIAVENGTLVLAR